MAEKERPVGSDPDEARDHEGKLMADKNASVSPTRRNGVSTQKPVAGKRAARTVGAGGPRVGVDNESVRRRRARGKPTELDAEWVGILRRDEAQRVRIEKWQATHAEWIAGGRRDPPPRPPWDEPHWGELSCTGESRAILRVMAAESGVTTLAELRDAIRCVASAASRFEQQGLKEVLLALSNCIELRWSDGQPHQDEIEHRLMNDDDPSDQRVNEPRLQTFHAQARQLLVGGEDAGIQTDAKRTGARFRDPRTGKTRRSAVATELVRLLERHVRDGLRGDELAAVIADADLWRQRIYSGLGLEHIRWSSRRADGSIRTESARARLEAWCADPTIDFDGVRDFDDFEALAVGLLRALGVEAKQARNDVSAAGDMRVRRRG